MKFMQMPSLRKKRIVSIRFWGWSGSDLVIFFSFTLTLFTHVQAKHQGNQTRRDFHWLENHGEKPGNFALFLTNTLPSLTKPLHFLNPATIAFVNFAVSSHILIFKNASTIATSIVHAILDYCNSIYHNFPNYQLNWLQQIHNFLARAVVKAPKSSHITPVLRSQHWLKVNERIEYKLLSLTFKVLTTSQPSYLNNLISVQPPRSTRSSSVVTLSRPPTISLKVTDRSFRYASPRLLNQLPDSFRQPRQSRLDSPPHSLVSSSLSSSPLSSSITLSLQAQTYLFNKSFPP